MDGAAGLEWNQPIPEENQRELTEWMSEVKAFSRFKIPRQYISSDRTPIAYNLHLFGDASEISFACAAYLESRYADGSTGFALFMSKSRLAPRDSPTLPRLEQLASLIAVRLKQFLVERMSIQFERVFFYTDSMITYHWVTSANPGGWKTFVSNRVTEIQADSRAEDWFHCLGIANISDLATRGVSAETLTSSPGWWFGPEWLRLPLDQRPISQPQVEPNVWDPVQREMRIVMTPMVVSESQIEIERYSTAVRAIRVLVNVLRFCYVARRTLPPSAASLYHEAESWIIKNCQQQHLSSEINAVRSNDRVSGSSKLASFQLFIDNDGLLRAKTRLAKAPFLTHDEKNPIIVPGESRLARLLIVDSHRVNAHFGVRTVLN